MFRSLPEFINNVTIVVTILLVCRVAWREYVAFLQAKVKINQLEDQKRQMDDAIVLFDKALTNNDAYAVPDNYLEPISTDFRDTEIVKFAEVNGTPSPSEAKVHFTFVKRAICHSLQAV